MGTWTMKGWGAAIVTAAPRSSGLLTSISISALVLPPVAVVSAALGAWRFGADPGWTGEFFIKQGLFSRYQSWFALAVAAQTTAFFANRWLSARALHAAPTPAGRLPD